MLAQIFLWVRLLRERHFMSNPPAAAGFEARSAGLRMAQAELLLKAVKRNAAVTDSFF